MRVAIPDDATDEQADKLRADAFQTALTHAASDPETRLRMILGETANAYGYLIAALRGKLNTAGPEVKALASKFATDATLVRLGIRDAELAALTQRLLEDAVDGC